MSENCVDKLRCSFSCFQSEPCGFYSRYPNDRQIVKLRDCGRDIDHHLKLLNLVTAAKGDVCCEADLVCRRAGIFTTNFSLTVCPLHRAKLGIDFKQGKSCTYPTHSGKGKSFRSITCLQSQQILEDHGVFVPVGSGICYQCYTNLKKPSTSKQNVEEDTCHKGFEGCSTDLDLESGLQPCKRPRTRNTNLQLPTITDVFSEDESITSSQPLSQISSWSQENMETSLDDINKALQILSKGQLSPVKFQVKRDISSLQPSTMRMVKKKAISTAESVLNVIAPGQGQELWSMIQNPPSTSTDDNLKDVVVNLYKESTDKHLKRQLLSMIAGSQTKKDLQLLIPGLTLYAIDEARKHASKHGSGAALSPKIPVFRQKMNVDKLDHALDFIFNPSFHQVSSFGVKEMKLENGSSVTIPEVVRTACHATLINIYFAFCKESDFTPLSRSTLFNILSKCPSSKRINLKGLDNVAADGGLSYDVLHSSLIEMERYALDESHQIELRECKDNLTASRIYLKTDFKVHLMPSDACPDHCINFALSDPADPNLQENCDHQHDIISERCQLLPETITSIKRLISELDMPIDVKADMLASTDAAEVKISEWKRHILRAVNQDRARTSTLENLTDGEGFIIMDWAMKFLPVAFREKQSDWFAQKGINWHVSVCIYRDQDKNLKQRTYAHTMDGVKQDWYAVACILHNTLDTIKAQLPNIKRVYLRSDNAGCYHCGNLWLAIPEISKQTGISIARYDYSEAQQGKSYCDAKIAHMRAKIRQSAASGKDILNAEDMKLAIDEHGGITACQSSNVEVGKNEETRKFQIKGISKLTNIQFEDDNSITTWRAFGMGIGNTIQLRNSIQFVGNVDVLGSFIIPAKADGYIKEPSRNKYGEIDEFKISCPESGCVCNFDRYSDMQSHCLLGSHKFELQQTSSYDMIKLRWKDACFDLSENLFKHRCETGLKPGLSKSEMGWALKRDRKGGKFSQKVTDYLSDIFEKGEQTGRKANPATVVKNMKVARNEDGGKKFQPHEYLELGQITSYFSRLVVMKKTKLPINESEGDQDLDAVLLALNKADTLHELL